MDKIECAIVAGMSLLPFLAPRLVFRKSGKNTELEVKIAMSIVLGLGSILMIWLDGIYMDPLRENLFNR